MPILADAQSTQRTDSRVLYRRLLGYVAPYKWYLIAAMIALSLAGAIEGMMAAYLQWLVSVLFDQSAPVAPAVASDSLVGKATNYLSSFHVDRETARWLGPVGLVVIFAASAIVGFIGNYGAQWVGNRVILDLREALFKKLLSAPVQYYDTNTTGSIISRVFNDVALVQQAATSVLTTLVKDSIQALVAIITLLLISWKLTLFILVVAPPLAVLIRVFSKRLREISRLQQTANAHVMEVLDEAVANHRVVKVFGGADIEASRFHRAANAMRKLTMKFCAAAAASSPITQLMITIAMAMILYYATASGEITQASELVGFIAAVGFLQKPLKNLSGMNEQLQRGLAGCESVFATLDSASEPDEGRQTITRCNGNIRLEQVSLTYPGAERAALNGIDLEIRSGDTVALVGSSGSGKTTLVHLLPRFYQPTHGRVLIDGVAVNDVTLTSLRQQIALVSQDIKLFNDTVANNIAYGSPNATREAIEAAAQAAYASDFIRAMPGGFNASVGENGGRMSGGQRQRIAIARAFLKDAPILLLDEATSALDTESERQVQAALETLMKGRTTIVVAHRLSTIERADRIIVMSEGRIVEQGTHASLIATKGAYAALHAVQFGT
jgi:ATP-binding cassette, subfamily B, bacterial MsbA